MTTKPKPDPIDEGDPATAGDVAPTDPTADTAASSTEGLTPIELAYPWTDDHDVEHAPDETVHVSAERAATLIRDGRARPVGTTSEKE